MEVVQASLTALIVASCGIYALRMILPARWQQRLANALLALPWPVAMAKSLRHWLAPPAAAVGCAGCAGKGCGGKGFKGVAPSVPPQHPIRIHRRPGR